MWPDPAVATAFALALDDEARVAAVALDPTSGAVVAEWSTPGSDPRDRHRVGTAIRPLLLAAALDAGAITLQTPLHLADEHGRTWWPSNLSPPHPAPPRTLADTLRAGSSTAGPRLMELAGASIVAWSRTLPFAIPAEPFRLMYGDFEASPMEVALGYGDLVRAASEEGVVARQAATDTLEWLPQTEGVPGWIGGPLAVGLAPERVVVLWTDEPRAELVRMWRELAAVLGTVWPLLTTPRWGGSR